MFEERLLALEAEVAELQQNVRDLFGAVLNRHDKNRERRDGERVMHKITCSQCGDQNATLPFSPVPGREYFCKRCHKNRLSPSDSL